MIASGQAIDAREMRVQVRHPRLSKRYSAESRDYFAIISSLCERVYATTRGLNSSRRCF
jgi:hypothetical protein